MDERCRRVIINLSSLRRHDPRKHAVHGIYHGSSAPEVRVKVNPLPPMPGTVARIALHKQAGLRHAEAINGLLHIAHEEQPAVPHDRGKDQLLHGVGILVFIHEHIAEAAAVFARHCLVLKERKHLVFHVGIIYNRALRLCLRITRIKRGDSLIQFPHGGILRVQPPGLR